MVRQQPYIASFLLLLEMFQVCFGLVELIGHFALSTLFILGR